MTTKNAPDPAAISRLKDAASEIEATAYDLAGTVQKDQIARLILIAAQLEKVIEKFEHQQ